jgi:hypothetical protein
MHRPARPWDSWLEMLACYRREHGHARVPVEYKLPDGTALGTWLARRRRDYRHGRLTAARIESLRSVGVEFGPPPPDDGGHTVWHQRLAALAAYRERHGHVAVPVKHRTADGLALGHWLAQQRTEFRGGRLGDDRAAALRALGVDFHPRTSARPGGWPDWLALLSIYRTNFGDTDVPYLYLTPGGEHLGNWLLRQRRAYWDGTLSAERASALRELGVMLEKRTRRRPHNRKPRRPTAPPWRPKNWPIPERQSSTE